MLCPKEDKGASSGLLIDAVLNIRICLVLCPKADKGASLGLLIVAGLNISICVVLCPKADKGASSGVLIVAVLNIQTQTQTQTQHRHNTDRQTDRHLFALIASREGVYCLPLGTDSDSDSDQETMGVYGKLRARKCIHKEFFLDFLRELESMDPPPSKEETWPPLPMDPPSRKKKHGPGH